MKTLRCEEMLRSFHGLLEAMLDASVPTLVSVRGYCLGGGLELADHPLAAALEYVRGNYLPRSAASLRLAVRALRAGFAERFRADLRRVERLYLDELMKTDDASEGLAAFLEKREPSWSDR